MGLSIAELEILLKARDEASAVIARAEKGISGFAQSIERFAKPALLSMAAITAVLAGATFLAAKAAIEDQVSYAGLAAAVDATGLSFTGATEDGVMAFVNSLENFSGFSKVDVMDALRLLTEQTGSVEEAMRRERIAVDFARGAHLDLYTASKLLGKVTDETINVLARYGIHVDKGTTATELFALVQEKFSGQAAAFASTVEGKWEKLQNRMHDLEAGIGAALLPTFSKLLDKADEFAADELPKIIKGVGEWLDQNPQVIAYGAGLLGVIAALALIGVTVGPIAAALSLLLTPLGLILLAVGALSLAWAANFGGIRDKTKSVTDDIGSFMDGVRHAFEDQTNHTLPNWARGLDDANNNAINPFREGMHGLQQSATQFSDSLETNRIKISEHQDQVRRDHEEMAKWEDRGYKVGQALGWLGDNVLKPLTNAVLANLGNVLDGIIGTIQTFINLVSSALSLAQQLSSVHISLPSIPNPFAGGSGSNSGEGPTLYGPDGQPLVIPGFANGGTKDGDGLAYLHDGETVSPAGESSGGDVHFHFHAPVYGVDDLRDTILGVVRDTTQAGGFRGVMGQRR